MRLSETLDLTFFGKAEPWDGPEVSLIVRLRHVRETNEGCPVALFLTFFCWTRCGDEDLDFGGDSVLFSLDVLDGVFLSCLGGGSFSEVTATFDVLSRNA